ncbi:Uncharacterised protein [Legionella beliardensis]|uniref:DUF883 domain-containing protein n=1 Tax=Legionella beliardensis TaxID=91822 RepID=A0A378HZQ3_9GAMM|nr:hypothetical protein [Legionella beliardensis]STX27865.1 Uncharacterised protein [Legionella beliardensis]
MAHLHQEQEQKRDHFNQQPLDDLHQEHHHNHHHHNHFNQSGDFHNSQKPWFKRAKQRFIELFHDSRDKVADTQSAIKNYSNTAVQKIVDRPLPYLIAASAVGFLLSSLFRRK